MTRLSALAVILAAGFPLAVTIGGVGDAPPARRPVILGMDKPVYLGGVTVVATSLPARLPPVQ